MLKCYPIRQVYPINIKKPTPQKIKYSSDNIQNKVPMISKIQKNRKIIILLRRQTKYRPILLCQMLIDL